MTRYTTPQAPTNSYATDGKCHNAEAGTYGHECGKPAAWIGTNHRGFSSGFCDDCKRHGYEARDVVAWHHVDT
ncbi:MULTISPECIES: hypothetical protein [Pseudomonadota]|uniref:KlcB n=1 Tax=Acidovorax ebreus (strain TPSY) TaxID=535289 RepID=A0A9J9Q7T1_ACIET|nr:MULTISPECIES: hypothetical protein [Pseudomonadota]ACM33608.1 conserved hypothetical protein [[Acidovorax] ebreus TPSY]QSQ54828.1 hypothetical protein ISN36_19780 [Xanthomonas translucens pv. undulosa]QSQ62225.1 hypothetical protein ISN38_19615 [Xanthomonas translucens pv. undulosa]UKE41835.1 hypothetical protein KCU58_20085 [Xanthomonas translucens pv. undulosa]UPU47146.1 hypothetical protein MZO50_00265 [Xanthomonas translucens pv. undulosa]